MDRDVFAVRRRLPGDVCDKCGAVVDRVWLVPGDVLDSCSPCFQSATGQLPVHEQGHSSVPTPVLRAARPASFYLRVDGRRPV